MNDWTRTHAGLVVLLLVGGMAAAILVPTVLYARRHAQRVREATMAARIVAPLAAVLGAQRLFMAGGAALGLASALFAAAHAGKLSLPKSWLGVAAFAVIGARLAALFGQLRRTVGQLELDRGARSLVSTAGPATQRIDLGRAFELELAWATPSRLHPAGRLSVVVTQGATQIGYWFASVRSDTQLGARIVSEPTAALSTDGRGRVILDRLRALPR